MNLHFRRGAYVSDMVLICKCLQSCSEVLVYHSFLCMDEIEMDEQREGSVSSLILLAAAVCSFVLLTPASSVDEEGSRSFVLIVQNFLGRPRTPLKLTAPTVEEKRFWLADIKKCFGWVSDTTHHTPLPHRAFGERHMCGTLLKRGDKIKSWRPRCTTLVIIEKPCILTLYVRYFRHVGDKLEYFLESCEEEV